MKNNLLNKFTGNLRWAMVWILDHSYTRITNHFQSTTYLYQVTPVTIDSATAVCRDKPILLTAMGWPRIIRWPCLIISSILADKLRKISSISIRLDYGVAAAMGYS